MKSWTSWSQNFLGAISLITRFIADGLFMNNDTTKPNKHTQGIYKELKGLTEVWSIGLIIPIVEEKNFWKA